MDSRAVILSSAPAEADRRLWYFLRNRRLAGYKFRRRHPVGPYIVEFVCVEQRLIVEIDGGRCAASGDSDELHYAPLKALGYRVLRFTSDEVSQHTAQVLARIYFALDASKRQPVPRSRAKSYDRQSVPTKRYRRNVTGVVRVTRRRPD